MMYSLSLYVNRCVNVLMKLALWLCIVFCVVMTVATLAQVLARMTNWFMFEESEEIARFSMCWLAMLGSAVALRKGRHLGVRLFVEKLPAGVYDRYVAPFVQIVMLAFFLMVTIKGYDFALRGFRQVSPSMFLPMFYPYFCLPAGGALMALNVISDMLQDRFPTQEGSTANIASSVGEDMDEIRAQFGKGDASAAQIKTQEG